MTIFDRPFTMSFKDAMLYGIDYREYEKVSRLPEGVPLMAIAGVCGDYANIRCLFADEAGNRYLRSISGRGGEYVIRELGVNAKGIATGTVFVVEGRAHR
ncbi:MAG: hypothetical protein ACK8QZ_01915 [Anaerolineales bacterium]